MNSKTAKYLKGTLEREGMGEVAYFFKKAGQNINYATYALDNTKFDKALLTVVSISSKINEIRRLANDVIAEIDQASVEICDKIQEEEDKE